MIKLGMFEAKVLEYLPEFTALLPIISIVYKVYFKKPKLFSKETILDLITKTKGEIVPIGMSDVTPPGSNKSYTLEVETDGTGILQIAHPDNKVSKVLCANEDNETNIVKLNGTGQGTFLITEQDDQKQTLLLGALVYKP